jgi:hypothetical protein
VAITILQTMYKMFCRFVIVCRRTRSTIIGRIGDGAGADPDIIRSRKTGVS